MAGWSQVTLNIVGTTVVNKTRIIVLLFHYYRKGSGGLGYSFIAHKVMFFSVL